VHPGMLRYVDVDGTERATENRARLQWGRFGGWVGAIICWTDCTVSMVSRYVRNMIKFENNEQPVQSRHLPAHGPIAVANPPTPSLAPPFHTPSYTQRHPIAPVWASLEDASPCTPGATPVKTAPRPRPIPSPRTALQARSQRLPALYSTTVTTLPT
jgi:hypothetical protein